jgi:hypothetical protein
MSRFRFVLFLWRLSDVFEVDRHRFWLPARALQFPDHSSRRSTSQLEGSASWYVCGMPRLRQGIPLRLARNEDRWIAGKRDIALPGYERSRVSPAAPAAHPSGRASRPKVNFPCSPLPDSAPRLPLFDLLQATCSTSEYESAAPTRAVMTKNSLFTFFSYNLYKSLC